MSDREFCPACGAALKKGANKFRLPVIIGGFAGFFSGVGFVAYWFGTDGGFTHNMAIIHEIAGTLLGLLAGLIVGSLRGSLRNK